jgi:transposase InsO family protein
MSKLGVSHKMTTAFHPQSNGVVERFHRRLKNALRARLAAADWPLHLPWVMLGLRAAPREDSGISAAELVFGAPLTLPAPIVDAAEPPPAVFVRQLQASFKPASSQRALRGSSPSSTLAFNFTFSSSAEGAFCLCARAAGKSSPRPSLQGPV